MGRAALQVGKIGLEDQRPVTEQPNQGVVGEGVVAAVDGGGVGDHAVW
jgi:hypothetical protein